MVRRVQRFDIEGRSVPGAVSNLRRARLPLMRSRNSSPLRAPRPQPHMYLNGGRQRWAGVLYLPIVRGRHTPVRP